MSRIEEEIKNSLEADGSIEKKPKSNLEKEKLITVYKTLFGESEDKLATFLEPFKVHNDKWGYNLFIQILNDNVYPQQASALPNNDNTVNGVIRVRIRKPKFTYRNINRILNGSRYKLIEKENKVSEDILNALLDYPNFPPLFGPASFLIVPIDEIYYNQEKWKNLVSKESGSVLFFNDELEMIIYNHTDASPYELTRALLTTYTDNFDKRLIRSILPYFLRSTKPELFTLVTDEENIFGKRFTFKDKIDISPIHNIVDLLNVITTNPTIEEYFANIIYDQNKMLELCDELINAAMPSYDLKFNLSTYIAKKGSRLDNSTETTEANVIFTQSALPVTMLPF